MDAEKYVIKSGDSTIVGVREKGFVGINKGHKYIIFTDSPATGANTEAGFTIINHFFGFKKSRQKWYKDRNLYHINWSDNKGNKHISEPINYLIIAKSIREKGNFNSKDFNLPDMECYWLDRSVDISINFHKFDIGSKQALTIIDGTPSQQFGGKYPIQPQLDREGHFFTTFQPQLIRRIIRNRTALIDNSDTALHPDWVLDLRSLINDTISLLEITLNQIYIKAQYDLPHGWKFDIGVLGEKHGRRISDKLKWVRQICGKNLNIENERVSLEELRELRNHFNHFDPPSLVVTLEEAAIWLNQIIDIGFILIKIRKTMNLEISPSLINFIIQKMAIFNPEPSFTQRLPLNSEKSGYFSSTWGNEKE
jgi:hypothetical protein